jgi:hypothetical protein
MLTGRLFSDRTLSQNINNDRNVSWTIMQPRTVTTHIETRVFSSVVALRSGDSQASIFDALATKALTIKRVLCDLTKPETTPGRRHPPEEGCLLFEVNRYGQIASRGTHKSVRNQWATGCTQINRIRQIKISIYVKTVDKYRYVYLIKLKILLLFDKIIDSWDRKIKSINN